jgi:hypothetical protein
MRAQWEEETNKKLQSCDKDKQVLIIITIFYDELI